MADSEVAPGHIATELGRPLTAPETGQVTAWIADAEALITARLGDRVTDGDPMFALVVKQAVLRRLDGVLRGAGSASTTTVTVDDGAVTRKFDDRDDAAAGLWWFLPEWWTLLDPEAESPTDPVFESGTVHDYFEPDWLSTETTP